MNQWDRYHALTTPSTILGKSQALTRSEKSCISLNIDLYVLGDVLSFCSWDVRLCVGSRFEPEGDQPADEDDSSLKEALLGAVQCFATILLPAHHTVVRFRTHWRHICADRWNKYNAVTLKLH